MKRPPSPKASLAKIKHVRIHHISLFCLYLAAIFTAVGLMLWLKPVSGKGLIRTKGTVKAINSRVTSNTSAIMNYNVIEFTAADGKTYQFNGEPAEKPRHKAGTVVPIGYNKANPRFARDLSTKPPSGGAIFFFILSLASVLISLLFGWHHHLTAKHRKRQAAYEAEHGSPDDDTSDNAAPPL